MKKYHTITIPPAYDGRMLLKYLKNELAFSQTKISSVKYDPEGLLLNGERVTVRALLHTGDLLEVLLTDSRMRENRLIPNEIPLEILYEDDSLIAVNKPSGMVCHPAKGHLTDSLASALRAYFDRTDPEAQVHLVGRLDKETSGIVLCAKNAVAAAILMRDRNAEKVYTAAASGYFTEKEGTIALPMRYVRDDEGILRVEEGEEKTAETVYRVLSEGEDFSVLRVQIATGRMHQIRFHMAAAGHPLLGDRLYGKEVQRIGRTALHAGTLRFIHPFIKEEILLEAELPAEMRNLIP